MNTLHEEMVPLSEAENEVKVATQRLALLHLAFAKTLEEEFGWVKGKQIVLNSIKRYGEYVAERTKQGHQSLPKYGFWERREGKPSLCELGKIMLEMREPELGSMYCLIDPAKVMAADPDEKMIHTRCMILGHDECQFLTVKTTDKEKNDFSENKDWAYVDPIIDDFLKEKKG
ncbi:MAG: L-2-amino-thiazoline-4-carboxylic acid hydrolase [Candidatus Bathyarchaeota archaeon]|nr:L-2-amino-thiazoline-4-carboxylic acid hydrolase [Candidatus Bathyarchaeota archaeon]